VPASRQDIFFTFLFSIFESIHVCLSKIALQGVLDFLCLCSFPISQGL
jgi:hypothetical protein